MLSIIILIFISILIFLNGNIRYIILHPILTIPQAFKDIVRYFKHKEYNKCPYVGVISNYCSLTDKVFGCGKTLTMVKKARQIYKRYNDTWVWSDRDKRMVKQHVKIISNVALQDVPYIPWRGIEQFSHIEEVLTDRNDLLIYLLDEASTIFNSRDFKDNFTTESITRLLQLRKFNISLLLTSQRWGLCDKILRSCCSSALCTSKWWRIVKISEYSALDMENCQNLSMLRPLSVSYWFAKDNDFNSYNTYAADVEIEKKINNNEFLTTEEILNNAGSSGGNLDQANLKKKYQRKTKL